MLLRRLPKSLFALLGLNAALGLAGAATLEVQVAKPGARISPSMWGLFFEDINFGADGGLNAELIKNRSFEFPEGLMGWSIPGTCAMSTRLSLQHIEGLQGSDAHWLRMEASGGSACVENEGFRGIGVKAGERYDGSLKLRGGAKQSLVIEMVSSSGAVLASHRISKWSESWARKTFHLVPVRTEARARLRLTLEGNGAVELDRISLFPEKTWKHREDGLRADMVQALSDLGPGFLRFPGGCIVEGSKLDLRYQWKKTIGPVDERSLLINRWNQEFQHRPTPDYYQSFGLGFYEYFVLCEDLGAEALPILNCGVACQFNSGELAPMDKLDAYVQDMLDLIEFANGAPSTRWGAVRVAMGHPDPFNVKHLGVGNEHWGDEYLKRFAAIAKALKARHPEITLVASSGPSPDDERFKAAWPKLRELKADIVDEHCYARPDWFFDNAHRYDNYDRRGPKVFVGEYAAQSVDPGSPDNRNTWRCALAEAAFLTGLERNADVVRMAAYAPLFAHADAWQWAPNMIWMDNLHVLLTPNYHVQRLYARNRGDMVVPVKLSDLNPEEFKRLYASAVLDEDSGEVIIKLVNATGASSECQVTLAGVSRQKGGTMTLLRAEDPETVNSFDNPERVVPQLGSVPASEGSFKVRLPSYSFSILRLGL